LAKLDHLAFDLTDNCVLQLLESHQQWERSSHPRPTRLARPTIEEPGERFNVASFSERIDNVR
jgi:hypothetical protein